MADGSSCAPVAQSRFSYLVIARGLTDDVPLFLSASYEAAMNVARCVRLKDIQSACDRLSLNSPGLFSCHNPIHVGLMTFGESGLPLDYEVILDGDEILGAHDGRASAAHDG